ncbi:MAG: MCE family protein [Deltaproteobacteria bacterium]|nr:MCE family protein [Deltaproteobacteria bacterium]
MRWLSRLTTVVLILLVIGGAALLIRARMPNAQVGGAFLTSVRFRDASKLQPGSPVMIMGVRVGDITGLTIEGQFARVDLRLRSDLDLPIDSFVTRRADSIFKDSYLEIIRGDSPILIQNGQPIPHVEEGGSTDATLRAIGRTMPKIDNALERVHTFMIEGRKRVNGSIQQAITDADRWVAEGRIEAGLASADKAMERFEIGSTNAAETVSDAVPTVAKRLANFDKAITGARESMKDAKTGILNGFADARAGFDRADDAIADMKEVVAAIDEGRGDDWKGTLGRLVNDPELGNTLDDVSGDAAESVAGLNRFRSWVGGRMEINLRARNTRYYASAEIYARRDKFYLIEFEKSLLGGEPFANLSDVPGSTEFTQRQQIEDKLRFTAQFGKRIGNLQLRAGLKDSTAGLGADVLMFRNRLRISADLFGSFERTPRLKVAGAFAVFRSLYVMAGIDDALNAPGELPIRVGNTDVPELFKDFRYGRDYFVGVGLKITDADLTTMLRFYGTLITAYALSN